MTPQRDAASHGSARWSLKLFKACSARNYAIPVVGITLALLPLSAPPRSTNRSRRLEVEGGGHAARPRLIQAHHHAISMRFSFFFICFSPDFH